jgi:hypothetical protein
MDAYRRLSVLVAATAVSTALVAGPVLAVEPGAEQAPASQDEGNDGSGRIQLAETPRDRLGLILFGALAAGGGLALGNARRQLKGERPQASGEFRWR